MGVLPGLGGMGGMMRGSLGKRSSYMGQQVYSSSASSFSFSKSFGTAEADRVILLGLVVGNGRTISSVTIGGVAATLSFQSQDGLIGVSFAYATVPTGASGTIAITTSGTTATLACFVWSILGVSGEVPNKYLATTSSGMSQTLGVAVGDLAFIVAANSSSQNYTVTMTSSTITEQFDGAVSGVTYATAADGALGISSALVTVTISGTGATVTPKAMVIY